MIFSHAGSPGPHPRLLFTAEELPALRAAARDGLRGRMLADLVAVCERVLAPGSEDYLDFRERQRYWWRERRGIFHVLPRMNGLATAYAFTGELRYGCAARHCLMTIIEHGLADVETVAFGDPYRGWRHGAGHDKGKFAQTLAYVYDFCHDLFDAAQRQRVGEYARECIQIAAAEGRFDVDQSSNNRGVRGLSARTWLHLALEGEADLGESADKAYAAGITTLELYLFRGHDDQGAPYEGPDYCGCIGFVAALAEALRRRGCPNLLTNSRFERLLDYFLYELVPGGGTVNNLNDAHTPCGTVAGCLPVMGQRRGTLLPWLARQLDLHPSRAKEKTERALESLPWLRWWRDDVPVKTPVELGYPLSHCFRIRGVASMRTGWETDDWLVSHFCGRQERRCHRQGDYNHVSLYALGQRFLADAGYGDVGQPARDTVKAVDRWYMRTDAHNCVLIDGRGFRDVFNEPGWCDGSMLDFAHTADFDTSLGDASGCIGPDHHVRRALRRVVLVKSGPARYVVVLDVNEVDGREFVATAQWQTWPDNRIGLVGGGFVIDAGEVRCVARLLWPTDGTVWRLGQNMLFPHAQVDVRGRVVETVTVFCPLRAGEVEPSFTCKRLEEGLFEVACERGGGRSVLRISGRTVGPLRAAEAVTLRMDG